MFIYIIAFIFTAILLYAANINYIRYKTTKGSKIYLLYFIASILPLGLVSGLRYDVGTDYSYTYTKGFYAILNGENYFSEFGFNYFIKFTQLFTDEPYLMFFLLAMIFSFCINYVIFKYSKNTILSILYLFFSTIFFWSMNNVRQAVAVSILFFSLPYFINKNDIKFLICLLCSLIFHYSSIIFILPYIAYRFSIFRRHYLVYFILAVLLIPVVSNIFIKILENTKYDYFFNSDFNNGKRNIFNIILSIWTFLLINFYFLKRIKTKEDEALYIIQSFSVFFSLASFYITASEMVSRIIFIFTVFNIITIPNFIYKEKTNLGKLLTSVLFYSPYILYFTYTILIKGYHEVLPYQSIFSLF